MVYRFPRTGPPMPRERWISQEAGFSPALVALITKFFDKPIPEEHERVILRGILRNEMFCVDYLSSDFSATALHEAGITMYKILEVCRRYGHSVVAMPTVNFSKFRWKPHPWIDTGNHHDAIVKADLVVAQGQCPSQRVNYEDWEALQSAFAERASGKNKPSLFLDMSFEDGLPVVSQSIKTNAFLDNMEDSDA